MIVKLRKIGNSMAVLLPKAILKQCPVKDKVSLEIIGNTIVIRPRNINPREGWEEQFLNAGSLNDNETLLGGLDNSFDDDEWIW